MDSEPSAVRVADDTLLEQMTSGDGRAFSELFRRRHADVFRFALHMTSIESMAEDIVQDVFLIVMRDAGRYDRTRGTVAGWLCGIARNCVRQRFERDSRLVPLGVMDDLEPWSGGEQATDPLAGLMRDERLRKLRQAIQALPLPYRETLVLCDLQEMSYVDAADLLSCPVGTVRSRLHRARALLAAALSAREEEVAARAPAGEEALAGAETRG
jgi:RNA polymerase sigma-70 factor (ECF subfamily)